MSKIQGPNFRRLLGSFSDSRLGVLFLLVLLLQIVFGAFQSTFAPFTLTRLGLNSTGNAIFFTIFGVILAVVQGGMIGPLSKRFGERRLIFVGLGLLSLGLFLASLTWEQAVPWYSRASLVEELTQVPGADASNNAQLALLPPEAGRGYGALLFMVFGLLPMPIGFGILQPSVNSLITKRADPRKIGEALGTSAAFLGLGNALGPIIGGVLFDRISPWAPMGLGGIAGFLLLFLILRRLKPDADDEDIGQVVAGEA